MINNKLTYKDISISRLFIMLMPVWVLFQHCTGLKGVSEKDPLLDETHIEYGSNPGSDNDRELKYEIDDVIIPQPNNKFLWMRPALAIYNFMGEPKKEKGLRHWIKNKIGKPPVKLSDVNAQNIADAMENRLFHHGFFNASVDFDIVNDRRTADLKYRIDPGTHYRFDSLTYPDEANALYDIITSNTKEAHIQQGNSYQLSTIMKERDRLASIVEDSGYYYFKKDHLLFRADTFTMDDRVKLSVWLKETMPQEASRKMYIKNIYIHDDFSLDQYDPDTTLIEGMHFISQNHQVRPEVILDKVYLEPGKPYSRTLHFRSLNNLTSFNLYRYIRSEFREDSVEDRLNAYIFMTPIKKNAVSAELNSVIKTTNYVGPGLNLSWRNRNIFGGAEMLSLNLTGNFEVQVGMDSINTSYELAMDAGLEIPRIVPFKIGNIAPEFLPLTQIKLGTSLYRRVELYTLSSFYGQFGYRWRQSAYLNHILRIADISYSNLSNQSPAFREYLETNPILKRSFEEQFIVGTAYSLIHDQLNHPSAPQYYLGGAIETSGNMISLFSGRAQDNGGSSEEFLGVPYSQFIKFRGEYRHYYRIGRNDQLAARTIIGVGIPYGNSDIIPYVRQFFAGGTNSVRAFVSRSIGPGSYTPPVENIGVDRTGDIKLEANLEYRLKFSRLFRGALFVDAGNVWIKNADPERPGADFQFDRFWREIAIGGGLGLRIDVDFVVFRIDMAVKMHDPSRPEGDRWVLRQIDPGSPDWWKNNFLMNIAIGYPF